MKRRFDTYFPWLFSLADFTASSVSLWFVSSLLFEFGVLEEVPMTALLPLSVMWLLISSLRKDYKIGRTDEYEETLKQLTITVFWFLGAMAVLWVPMQSIGFQLIPILFFGIGMTTTMGIFRVGIHIALRKYRAQGNNYRNAVIIGKGGTSPRLADVFRIRKDFGINFLGYFDNQAQCDQTRGNVDSFFSQAEALDLDLIYIHEQLDAQTVKRIINFADENYIKVKMIPGGSLQLEKNLSFSRYGDFFVINVNEIPLDNAFNAVLKRVFDVLFSLFMIVAVLSWLIPLVGILIKWESRGPIFFIQKRNGINNSVFNCLKFRSMTPNDYADEKQATKNDPRVTRIGAFLRRTSLDEMPQFINVLLGDMSIVGPRPHTVPMNKNFKTQIERYDSRHKIRPGITGLAQVRGYRGEIENPYQIRNRVRLDSFYINNWSFLLDMGIMAKTFREVVFNKEDAY
ncbi:exopolysaccharide biosynthesis polyprenyl glycosylphosphotransferase [Algoriphagus namhaensis]